MLRVARVVERTESEGPGQRFAVWVQGCSLRCAGCCNAEMFPARGGAMEDPQKLAERASACGVDGVTLLGGEPFEQVDACAAFAREARARGLSVMTFTGFTIEELAEREGARALIDACDLLVDGRFVREELDASRRWIGSKNQRMHFLTARYDREDPRFRERQTAEIRFSRGEIVMNGWPSLVPQVRRSAR